MIIADALAGSSCSVSQVAVVALRCLLLGGFTGFGLVVFRVKSASVQLLTWTLVLYGALAMPFLGLVLPPVSAPILQLSHVRRQSIAIERSLFATPAEVQTLSGTWKVTRANQTGKTTPRQDPSASSSPSTRSLRREIRPGKLLVSSIFWSKLEKWAYLAVLFVLLGRLGIGMVLTRRLVRIAKRIDDRSLDSRVAWHLKDLRSSSAPKLTESEAALVPVTVGVLRPVIVLPVRWREWESKTLDAVIAHEVSHVARRDALTQLMALLHRAVFWFSPFAWWLQHHLAILAEQASDEAVLSGGADRANYAQTLLGFFDGLQASRGRVWWQGVAMAKAGQAELRVEKILAWRGVFGMRSKTSMAALIIAMLLPVVYLTASVSAAQQNPRVTYPTTGAVPQSTPVSAPTADAPIRSAPTPGEPAPALAPTTGSAPEPAAAKTVAPVAPDAPVASVAPVTAWSDQASSSDSADLSYTHGYDDDARVVIMRGNGDSLTMSGSSQDAHHAEQLRKNIPGDFIWFQRGDKSYVIRDQATTERALKLWAPPEESGKKQEALDKQQDELGHEQQATGKKMEQVRVNVADMTAELDKLKAELKGLRGGATRAQIGDLQSEIGELQRRIGELQSYAGEQQSKMGAGMSALGAKQGELGRLRGELERQQGELGERAAPQMKELLDEAIKNGKAQPEPEGGDPGSI